MMMGSLEKDIANASAGPPPGASEVVNDLDIEEEEVALESREVYLAKVGIWLIINEFKDNNKYLVYRFINCFSDIVILFCINAKYLANTIVKL
jgi:hypothetical protein